MQRPDDIRASLVLEIERKEQQLLSLRQTLATLDAALKAAADAHAAAVAAQERAAIAAQGRTSSVKPRPAAPSAPAPVERRKASLPAPGGVERRASLRSAAPKPEKVAPPPPPLPPSSPAPKVEKVAPPPPPAPVSSVPHTSAPAGKYANMKIWTAVQNLITENRASMTLEEIIRGLEEGGASLGDNPARTVSTAIGYMNDKIFHVSKSGNKTIVSVLRPSVF